jgi:hypothetical protein
MKTNLPSLRLLSLFFLTFGLTGIAVHAGDDGSTATIKLSSPGKPATLRVDMPWADIHITGVDGDTVTVESTIDQKGAKETRSDGLRRLDDEVSFELTEHENVVSLRLAGDNPWANHDAEFKISMPRAMAIDVKTEAGGDLTVKNTEGDIEVSNMNGEVLLDGISGSTVVNTMNGEVRAIYAKAPQKLVSITSMNGEVDLRVPADTKANVRLRTHNGSILTDFDESVLKTKSEGKGSGYNYGSDAARMSADAARAAADATRMAIEVSREVAREVKREVERAVKEDTDSDDATPATNAPPRAPRPPHVPHIAPIPPITGGKVVSGTLNGGGVDIKVSTMNGEITLRQTNGSIHTSATSTPDNVTVTFQDPDKFTDVRENGSNDNSTAYLDELQACLQQTATPLLAAGQKLAVTITDVDLAGENRLNQPDQIRVMKEIYAPRVQLRFRLLGADGKVVKEGERKLQDPDYLTQAGHPGSEEPLYYDKQLLKRWLQNEFKAKS